MDWLALVVGAVLGALVGLLVQNILFPTVLVRLTVRRTRSLLRKVNTAWVAIERLHPRLVLIQAGWDRHGYFPEDTITLRLGKRFVLDEALVTAHREPHRAGWELTGHTDGEQVGIASLSIKRMSDEPEDELEARSHHMHLDVHQYRYFDFLATHDLRLKGIPAEQARLNEIAGAPAGDAPVPGFPNPCSVGLSLFCEAGGYLVLPRRSRNVSSGGGWEGGKIYNAVGENAALRDFSVALDGSYQSTPGVIAKRGLYEEMGLTGADISECVIHIHSLAWATDLLDHKFFGVAITSMPRLEIQHRWRGAPDHAESAGCELEFKPVRTRPDCLAVLRSIRDEPDEWAPEAVFSTVRSLLLLGRIKTRDMQEILS